MIRKVLPLTAVLCSVTALPAIQPNARRILLEAQRGILRAGPFGIEFAHWWPSDPQDAGGPQPGPLRCYADSGGKILPGEGGSPHPAGHTELAGLRD